MAKFTTTLAADGTADLGMVHKKHDADSWFSLFFVYGTWGGGTLAWKWSPDGGTTKLDMKDLSGSAMTSTANDSFSSNFATGAKNTDKVHLYAVLTGSTSPSLTIGYFDNN